jgi:hypothetical protein
MPGRQARTATRLAAAIDDIMLDYPTGDGPSFDRAAHLARYRETIGDALAGALHVAPGGWRGASPDPQAGHS